MPIHITLYHVVHLDAYKVNSLGVGCCVANRLNGFRGSHV